MPRYTLIDHVTGEEHPLEFENVVDIQCALRNIEHENHIHKGECFTDTKERMEKVSVPITDY